MTIEDMYAARRRRVLELLGQEAALIVPASPELLVGLDAEVRYVVDPDLYYLTGYREPEALLVLCPSYDEAPYTLFVRPRDPERELWTGVRGGPETARERFGADAAHSIAELPEKLHKIVAATRRLYARLPSGRPDIDRLLAGVLARARRQRPRTGKGPLTITDYGEILNELRLRKDTHEIAAIRDAARITVETFLEAVHHIRPGAGEWTVEAALEGGFRARGGSGPAFPTIVAAGANATVLHYVENGCVMQRGQMLLVDAGARMGMYCADVTRVFPVGGEFTTEQRLLYDGVRSARDAALAAVAPGASIKDVHLAALRVLLGTLSDAGLLATSVEQALENEEDYKQYFPHRTSHWLGLDVHDVGDYVIAGESRILEPGMVLTIEPGLYISNSNRSTPLSGVGVRIEDDVLVTAGGHDVLTSGLPADAETMAALVR